MATSELLGQPDKMLGDHTVLDSHPIQEACMLNTSVASCYRNQDKFWQPLNLKASFSLFILSEVHINLLVTALDQLMLV